MDWEKTIEPAWLARAMRVCTILAIPVGVFAIILRTHEPIAAPHGWLIVDLIWIVTAYLALDLVLRFGFAVSEILRYPDDFRHLLHIYLADFNTITDIVAAFAVPLPAMFGASVETAELFGLLWLLKLARHAHGLSLLGRVIRSSAQALLSVLLSFSLVLIAASTVAYLAERETQPEQFGSIPLAMWWAIVTLTTTGYGDATPATLAGRVLAGAVMMCGIGVFALWAGIIASGFSDELKRRDFLRTWDLVAKVPFFSNLGADLIASVARRLKRRDVSNGQVLVRRGQPGESMFFIVSGEVEIQVEPKPVRMRAGNFFGELALITGAPRSATVTAALPCVLLELDVADFRLLTAERPELMRAIAAEADRHAQRAGTKGG